MRMTKFKLHFFENDYLTICNSMKLFISDRVFPQTKTPDLILGSICRFLILLLFQNVIKNFKTKFFFLIPWLTYIYIGKESNISTRTEVAIEKH